MARLNEPDQAHGAGPRLSLLPEETAEDIVVCSLDWLKEATETPEKLDQAFEYIIGTVRDRDRLKEKIQTQTQAFDTQTQAHDAQIADLIAERDELNSELLLVLRQHAREPTPAPVTAKKSTKIPDPPILTDGKNPTFEGWLLKVKNKLKVNADHFADEDAKIAYVQLLTDGEASQHIQPRLEDDAADPYTTYAEVLSHLQSIYEDPNRIFNAKNEFKKLFMKSTQPFHEFYTRFLHLSGRAQIAPSELKYELYNKLSFDLQRQVIAQFHAEIPMKAFADHCGVIDQSLKAINERQNKGRTNTRTPSSLTPTPTTANTPSSPTAARNRPRMTADERQKLFEGNKCFYCKAEGHRAIECPVKAQSTQVKVIEEETSEDPGKGNP